MAGVPNPLLTSRATAAIARSIALIKASTVLHEELAQTLRRIEEMHHRR